MLVIYFFGELIKEILLLFLLLEIYIIFVLLFLIDVVIGFNI